MSMTIENHLCAALLPIGNEPREEGLDSVAMAMGHENPHPKKILNQYFRIIRRDTVAVAVARHLIKTQPRVLRSQLIGIAHHIPQMNHRIGLQCFHTALHKILQAMGIRQNQYSHDSFSLNFDRLHYITVSRFFLHKFHGSSILFKLFFMHIRHLRRI